MNAPEQTPLVAVGDVVIVSQTDHYQGSAPLRLRVTEPPTEHPGLEWILLTGREVWYHFGQEFEGLARSALVRVAALRAQQHRGPGERRLAG